MHVRICSDAADHVSNLRGKSNLAGIVGYLDRQEDTTALSQAP